MSQSMIWTARYADAQTLAALRASPDSIGQFLVGTDLDEAQLDAPADVHNVAIPFDLDDQWQAIHFLLRDLLVGSQRQVGGLQPDGCAISQAHAFNTVHRAAKGKLQALQHPRRRLNPLKAADDLPRFHAAFYQVF